MKRPDRRLRRPVTVDVPTVTGPAAIQVAVVPEFGAKVVSLRRIGAGAAGQGSRSGREWLAQPIRPPARPTRPEQPWSDFDCSGWDECFPNVGASTALGLPDHGEVWRHPWTVTADGAGLHARLETPRYRFSRTLAVHGNALLAEYHLVNLGLEPLAWSWAQHPLLSIDEHCRLVVNGAGHHTIDSAFRGGRPDPDVRWLAALPTLDLIDARDRAVKLWLDRPHPVAITVHDRRASEWIRWDIESAPTEDLGLWINFGGWGGAQLRHLAVEPAFGRPDDPERALANGIDRRLQPGTSRSWRTRTAVGAGVPEN